MFTKCVWQYVCNFAIFSFLIWRKCHENRKFVNSLRTKSSRNICENVFVLTLGERSSNFTKVAQALKQIYDLTRPGAYTLRIKNLGVGERVHCKKILLTKNSKFYELTKLLRWITSNWHWTEFFVGLIRPTLSQK